MVEVSRKARMRLIIILLSITLGLVTLNQANSDNVSVASVQQTPPTGTYFDHLVFIMMENWGIQNICGRNPTSSTPCNGSDNPYMSSLARNFTIGQKYTSVFCEPKNATCSITSQPNYVAIIGGSTFSCPSSCSNINAPTLVDRFQTAGLSWKAYMENQQPTAGCDTSSHEPYNNIHNPFISFREFVNSGVSNATLCNKILLANPSGCGTVTDCRLVNDLNNASAPAPNFMWLTPDDCNNMHGASVCTNGCTSASTGTACRQKGDSYLKSLVPSILTSQTFTTTRSALFITFDEGQDFCPFNGSSINDCIYSTWAGPVAKNGFIAPGSHLYNHYNFTHTVESNWNLATLTSHDAGSSPMTEYFNAQSPDFTVTTNPTSLMFPFGNSANSMITLNSLGGFAGPVTLTKSSTPTGLTLTLNPTSVTLTSGGTGTSTLTVSSSTVGNYTATVTGTGGGHTHNTTLTVRVTPPPNFALSVNPTSLTLTHAVSGVANPVTVNPTGDPTVFESSYLANSFYAKGLIWLFYEDSSNTCEHQAGCLTYTTSLNGSRWAAPTTVPVHITDSDFSVTTNGTSVFYARYNETSFINNCGRKLQFGLGSLSNSGTVAWQPERTVIAGASNRVYVNDEIIVDSNGQVWIAYLIDNHGACGGNSIDWPIVIHSAGTNYSAWTGNFTLSSANSGNWHIALATLGNGQVYASYWIGNNDVHGRLYNNGWQADEQVSSPTTLSDVNAWLFNSGTNIYSIYFDDSTKSFNFAARSSTGTWTINTIGIGESHIGFPGYYSLPDAASYDVANNRFHLFYMNATTQKIDEWTGSGNTWNKTTGVVTTTAVPYPDSITSFIQSNPTEVGGIFYISGSSAPFNINFAALTFASSSLTGSFTVTVTGQNGFTGTVTLSNSTTPPTGLTVICTVTTITGGSGSSTCNLSSSTPGSYSVNVTGLSGSLSHSASVAVTVPASPDFSITATTPSPISVGQSQTSTVTVTALNGFIGAVGLSTNSTACSVSPASVTGSGSATLSCTFTSALTVHVGVTGTSGSLSHSVTVTFVVQDFTMAASPTSVNVNVNAAGTSTITVTAVNGYTRVVSLTTNSTLCTVAPTSVTGSGSATLSCTFTSASTVHVGVTGTNSALSHSVTVTYQVVDFTITASPITVTVNAGGTGTSTITITAFNGFAGVVGLATNSTSCSIAPTSVPGSGSATLSCTFSVASNVHVGVTGTSGSLSHSGTVTYVVQDFTIAASPPSVTTNANAFGTSSVTVTGLNGFAGVVGLSTNSTSCSVAPNSVTGSGSSTLSCTFTSVGTFHVGVTGLSGSLSHSVTVTYVVQDFTVTASPTSVNVNVNAAGTSAITVTGLNGFAGVVSLATNSTSCSVAPASVTGSGSATVSCNSSTAGNYTITE